MKLQTASETLSFIRELEEKAAKFYEDLQKAVKHDASKVMLGQFAKMELNHARILERFKSGDIDDYEAPEITDLKLSDYMVEADTNSDMTYQEIIVVAMKREEAAKTLYTNLADES